MHFLKNNKNEITCNKIGEKDTFISFTYGWFEEESPGNGSRHMNANVLEMRIEGSEKSKWQNHTLFRQFSVQCIYGVFSVWNCGHTSVDVNLL